MSNYTKDINEVLAESFNAMTSIQKCVAYDGTVCAPNIEDLLKIALAKDSIIEYCNLRNINLKELST